MNSKELAFNSEARTKLMEGVSKVAEAVMTTLGPCGRNVVIEQLYESPTITKDGVTVAKEIVLEDRFENVGAQLLKVVSSKTNDVAGDGTTTATVIAYSIIKEGIKAITSGAKPIMVKRGIDKATKILVKEIEKLSRPINSSQDVINIASISANNDEELGKLVADTIEKVGKDGVVTVEESNNMDTTIEIVDGMQIDNGYLSSYFSTDKEHLTVSFNDAYVLITDKTFSNFNECLQLLDQVAKSGKQLLIIADNVEREALSALILNNMRGAIKVCAIKAPNFGSVRMAMLEDIASLTGGTLISETKGINLSDATIDMLGKAHSIKVDKDKTIIVGNKDNKDAVEERIKTIKVELEKETAESSKEILRSRIAKLTGGVAVISIGAITETEMKETRYRIEDTIAATRAALEEGIVVGGGVTLLKASLALTDSKMSKLSEDEAIGFKILKKAIEEPIRQIAENAGVDGSVIVDKIINSESDTFGYDAYNDEYVEDMFERGIVDPTKVTRCALQNASSVAGMLLTTECAIVNKPEESKSSSKGLL